MSWNPQRLNEAMILRGFSNANLGEELGVGWQTVARWGNDFNKGKYEPTLEQIWAISIITGFPYKHFVTEDKFGMTSEGIFY